LLTDAATITIAPNTMETLSQILTFAARFISAPIAELNPGLFLYLAAHCQA